MKKNAGFGVVAIILIAAVLILVGLIGWRVYVANENNYKSTANHQNGVGQAPGSESEYSTNTGGYTEIAEWQTMLPKTASGERISYRMDASQQFAYITTERLNGLANASVECKGAGQSISISRAKPGDDHFGSPWTEDELGRVGKKVGDYYYYAVLGQPCFGDPGFVTPEEIAQIRKDLSDSIKQVQGK